MYNLIIRPLLFCIDPEKVHRMLLSWLKFYRYLFPVRACVRGYSRVSDPFSYGHLQFKNRIGLSAGFDKNAEAFDELADFGFGFLEVGTVTPDSQSGNPSPRIFRLVDDESLISRTGFNNCGVDAVRQHIRKYRKHSYVLGVNINKNPLSTGDQIIKDFESTFIHLYDCVDYFTLNWGSIDNDLFAMVLEKLTIFRQAANKRCSIFIKLPADIDEKALDTVISLAYKYSIEGFIATGPTMDRSGLHQAETKQLEKIGNGGVSGRGIGKKSQEVVRYLSEHTDRHFLIIGAGGIMMVLCAELVGDTNSKQKYEKLAVALKAKLEPTFWNNQKQAFVHNCVNGQQSDAVTRYANMFSVFFQYLNEDKQQAIKNSVLLNDSILKITTPYMRFYELEALCALGEQDAVMKEMKAYWGGMLKEGATSFWEKYNPEETGTQHLAMYGRPYGKSLCHAWGASPIYLLGKYYLGVKPVKEGYKEFAIAPVLGGLKWMEGTVPTPNGNIHVYMNSKTMKVKATEGKGYLTIKSRRPPKANIGTPEKVSEGVWRLWIDSPEERIVTYHL